MPQHVGHKIRSLASPPLSKIAKERRSKLLAKYCIPRSESQLQDEHGIAEGIEAVSFNFGHFVKR